MSGRTTYKQDKDLKSQSFDLTKKGGRFLLVFRVMTHGSLSPNHMVEYHDMLVSIYFGCSLNICIFADSAAHDIQYV